MTNDNLRKLYDALSQQYNVGEFDAFSQKMNDPANRKKAYDAASQKYNLGSYEEFENKLGLDAPDSPSAIDSVKPSSQPAVQESVKVGGVEIPNIDTTNIPKVDNVQQVVDQGGAQIAAEEARKRQIEENIRRQAAQADVLAKKAKEESDRVYKEDKGVHDQVRQTNWSLGVGAMSGSYPVGTYSKEELQATKNAAEQKLAAKKAKEAVKVVDEAGRNSNTNFFAGVGRGFMDKASNSEVWTQGIESKMNNKLVLEAANKFENGESLTESEKALLDATALEAVAQQEFGGDIGRGYKAGSMTADSAPLIIEMLLSPASGMGKGIAKWGVKKFGVELFASLAKQKAAKVGLQMLGDVAGAATMTATSSVGFVMADTKRRQTGEADPLVHNEGIEYGGANNQEDYMTALGKSFGSRFVENYSEMFGEYFTPIGRALGKTAGKTLNKVGLSSVNDAIQKVGASTWARSVDDFMAKTQWNGVLGEWGEEQVGTVLHSIIDGDSKMSDLLDLDQQIDTFLGVSVMGGFMSAIKTVGYRRPGRAEEKKMNKADEEASKLIGEDWNELRESIDTSDSDKLTTVLSQNLQGLSKEQATAVLTYAGRLQQYRGTNIAEQKRREEGLVTPEEIQQEDNFRAGLDLAIGQAQQKRQAYLDYKESIEKLDDPSQQLWDLSGIRERAERGEDVSQYMDALNKKTIYEGLIQGIAENIDTKVEQESRRIDDINNFGQIVVVTPKEDDQKQLYVVRGWVAQDEDGNVDTHRSDQALMVRDENGKLEMRPASDFLKTWSMDTEETRAVTLDELRRTETEKAAAELETPSEEEKQDAIESIQIGDQLNLNMNGQTVSATVQQSQTANGTTLLLFDNPVLDENGKNVRVMEVTPEQLQMMMEPTPSGELVTPVEQQGQEQSQESSNVSANDGVNASSTTGEQSNVSQNVAEEQKTVDPYADFPRDKDGEIDADNLTVEQGILYAENEMGRDYAVSFAEKAAKALVAEREKVQKKLEKEINPVRSIKIEKEIAEIDNKIKSYRNYVTLKEEPIPVEAPVKQAAEPIKTKWGQAEKFEGGQDEIALANGEKIKGRYVLVDASAPTPSHNPEKNFSKSEGFPVNENGSTVNDRDYEKDKLAQNEVMTTANQYDQRALQTPVIVSKEGIVLSGNQRTMSGQLAASQGSDTAYNEYLKQYANKYGFTPDQVATMQHPRVVFVPESDMPYNTETFAKFNADDKKTMSKTEQAVKAGKTLPEKTLNKIAVAIDGYDTLGQLYGDARATSEIIGYLVNDGVIGQNEVAELMDGNVFSAVGQDYLENILTGAVLEEKAVRQISEMKDLRQPIIKAMAEIAANTRLGERSLTSEMSEAISLVYEGRRAGTIKKGDPVADALLQGNLFESKEYSDTTQFLANLLNKNQTAFKKALSLYNKHVQEVASGQVDMFESEPRTKDEIINDIKKKIGYEYKSINTSGTENGNPSVVDRGSVAGGTGAAVTGEQQAGESTGTTGTTGAEAVNPVSGDTGSESENPIEQIPTDIFGAAEAAVQKDKVKKAEKHVDTKPTDGQKKAGNYKMGHVKIGNYDITIENPKGSVREGVDKDGEKWSITMNNTYGYFRGTKGKDGDHIDVFLGDNLQSKNVFVVDQVNPDGSFDEHKVMLGFNTLEEAKAAYLSNYSEDWQGLGNITETSKENFDKWADTDTRKQKPFADYKQNAEETVERGIEEAKDAKEVEVNPEIEHKTVSVFRGQQKGQAPGKWFTTSRRLAQQFANSTRNGKNINGEVIETEISGNILNFPYDVTGLARISEKLGAMFGVTEKEIRDSLAETNADLGKGETIRILTLLESNGFRKLLSSKGVDFVKVKEGVSRDELVDSYIRTKDVQEEVKPNVKEDVNPKVKDPKLAKAEEEANAALDDFLKSFNDLNTDTFGIIDNSAEKQAKMLVSGTKMVGAFVKLGYYKFADIVKQIQGRGIQLTEELLTAIKKAYVAFVVDSDLEELDDMKTVRSFKLSDLQELTPDITGSQDNNVPLDKEPTKTKEDVPNRTRDSERDRQNDTNEVSGDAASVSGDGGRSGQVGNGISGNSGETVRQRSSQSGRKFQPTLFGEPSDNGVLPKEQINEKPTSGDTDGRGNGIDSPEGHSVGRRAGGAGDKNNTQLPETFKQRTARKIKEQQVAESVPVKLMDESNIRETLPLLLPEQQDDVLKAENRFFGAKHKTKEAAFGKGMLFTNGTGTGKTFTGLGIAKRFDKQGKKNILIVVPSEAKVNDWVKDGVKIGLQITPLESTKDKGENAVITTYANFRSNEELKERDFDLVMYDESHRLMEEKTGTASSTTYAHYAHSNVSERTAFERLQSVNPEYIKIQDLLERIYNQRVMMGNPDMMQEDYLDRLSKVEKMQNEADKLQSAYDKTIKPVLQERAKKAYENTKVVFLSATPFKGHFNLRYANGSLFDWGEETITNARGSMVDAESRFFLNNFGSAYEWRYHKLQSKRNSNAEAIAMQEVEFAQKLMENGVMSGRAIESDMDYSREFPLVALEQAEVINMALNEIYSGELNKLSPAARFVFNDYVYTTKLFESLKASMNITRIQHHLDLGRKVIIFHRRKQANVLPPFQSILDRTRLDAQIKAHELQNMQDGQKKDELSAEIDLMYEQIKMFENKYAGLLQYEQTLNYDSAIDQISNAFPNKVLTLNGDTPKKDKSKNVELFNDDNSGKDIIIIQEEAGKEGISLHDTTGVHQRVLISLSLPISSTTALQIEGRPYRIGNESNAIFEYPLLGLDQEISDFGQKINKKLSTTENLAIGNQARDLLRSFAEGVLFNSGTGAPHSEQGKGGKEYDKKAQEKLSEFRKAVLVYNTNQKVSGRRDEREGIDYYATPEPLGQKMVEWLGLQEEEAALEPSAGHGAIAMWFPERASVTAIEPSYKLFAKLNARSGGGNRKIVNDTFENFNIINKFQGVAMNPPFGSGGKTAIDHVAKAFGHLKNRGRIVAIIPQGQADKRLDSFLKENNNAHLIASIKLPNTTFEQAGTSVSTRMVVIDKIIVPTESDAMKIVETQVVKQVQRGKRKALMGAREEIAEAYKLIDRVKKSILPTQELDLSTAPNIDELFNAIEHVEVNPRVPENLYRIEEGKTVTEEGAFLEQFEQYNTRTGDPLFMVAPTKYVSRETYDKLSSLAKQNNGFYSSYTNKAQNIRAGFTFKTKEDADNFYAASSSFINNDEEVEDIRFREVSPIGFYSTVEDALSKITQEKGTKDQFRAMLLKSGAKQAEMDWMGFDELPDRLTKEDIQSWVDANRIDVEEVEKGTSKTFGREQALKYFNEGDEVFGLDENGREFLIEDLSDIKRTDRFSKEDGLSKEEVKYSGYVIPGGKNYKELLLTMPKKNPTNFEDYLSEYRRAYPRSLVEDEGVRDFFEKGDRINNANYDGFKSSHWEEPNILAHIRFDEREINGERVLFIEEFQSDWAQEGKKRGFGKRQLVGNFSEYAKRKGLTDEETKSEWERKGLMYKEWLAVSNEAYSRNPVPNMPFNKTDQWVNLAMRRMMRYAAENGFDRIAWTNGEQQSERYDLSRLAKEVEYVKTQDSYDLKVRDENDNPIIKGNYSVNELEGIVGKEITKKIVNGEGEDTIDKTKSLKGVDLKVGGEGMKAFYDGIVPSAMSKLVKPFGSKVENIQLEDASTVESVPVTESIKASVMGGVPIFRGEPSVLFQGTTFYKKEQIKKAAESLAKELNTPIRFVTREQMPKGHSTAKGYYLNGEVVICAENHNDIADVQSTILHEIVAHKGLREMFGDNFKTFLRDVYSNASKEVRAAINDLSRKYGYDVSIATEEYMASIAENGVKLSVWNKIQNYFRDMLSKFGVDLKITDNDIKYILWRSYQYQTGEKGIFADAKDVVIKNRLIPKSDQVVTGDIRFREETQVDYEKRVKELSFKFLESHQNNMLGLKVMQDQIEKETGKIEDFEDAYSLENHMSGINGDQIEKFKKNFYSKIYSSIRAINKKGRTFEDIKAYVIAKHGLERNREFAWRDAVASIKDDSQREQIEKEYNDMLYLLKQSLEKKAIKRDKYDQMIEEFRTTAIPSYVENRKMDYSGLSALTGEESSFEAAAQNMVDDFEEGLETETDELWKSINNATKETLKKTYTSGLMTQSAYKKVRDMFEYYVPLRGWDEEVASDVYEYITSEKNSFNAPLKVAKGRRSIADDPIATIGNVAESAILQGNKNLMKMRFLHLALNHKTDLLTVKGMWYENVGTKENPEWERSIPSIDNNSTPEEVSQAIEEHEQRMNELQKLGLAKPEARGLKIKYRASIREKSEHAVIVKSAGKEFIVYVNGNPRAAQAVNGLIDDERNNEEWFNHVKRASRLVQRMYTTYSPEFMVRNLIRDIIFSSSAAYIKEDKAYSKKFNRNIAKNIWFVFRDLVPKYQSDKLDMNDPRHRYFKEFIENGGETGYVVLNSIQDYKSSMQKGLKKSDGTIGSIQSGLRAISDTVEFMNRGAESISRFSAYMTSREQGRSILRSVSDAKEITVNFNRKGSGAMGSKWLKFLYFFFNASVQGLNNFNNLRKANLKKFSYVIAKCATAGVMIPVINNMALAMFGGDDDKDTYNDLSDWTRRNCIVLWCPWTEGKFIAIPLPIELRAFYGLGEMSYQLCSGNMSNKSTPEIMLDYANQIGELMPLNPLKSNKDIETPGQFAASIAPDLSKPVAQWFTNKDFFGLPIYKDMDYNKLMPAYTKAYSGTNKELVALAEKLNSFSGGDKYTPGDINLNPAVIEHLTESYTGGVGIFANKVFNTIHAMFNEEDDVLLRNIPYLSSITTESTDRSAFRRVNEMYFDYLDEYKATEQKLRGYKKDMEKGDEGFAKKLDSLYNTKVYQRYEVLHSYKKILDDYKTWIDESEGEERDFLKKEQDIIKAELVDQLMQIK